MECKNCKKEFAHKKNLIRHERNGKCHDSNSKSIKCPQCLRVFSRVNLLKKHTKDVHNNEICEENLSFENITGKCSSIITHQLYSQLRFERVNIYSNTVFPYKLTKTHHKYTIVNKSLREIYFRIQAVEGKN